MKSNVLYVIHDIPNLPDAPELEPFIGTYYYDTLNKASLEAKQVAQEDLEELSDYYENLSIEPSDLADGIPTTYTIVSKFSDLELEQVCVEAVRPANK